MNRFRERPLANEDGNDIQNQIPNPSRFELLVLSFEINVDMRISNSSASNIDIDAVQGM